MPVSIIRCNLCCRCVTQDSETVTITDNQNRRFNVHQACWEREQAQDGGGLEPRLSLILRAGDIVERWRSTLEAQKEP